MIFQDPFASLIPRWRVKDIVAEPLRARGASATLVQTHVAELLSTVGLSPKDGRKFPHEFSGGQRQRIAIARALASEADFIVCDEPTSALDVSVQAQILNLARDLQEQLGLTLLFISHNLAVVRHMADRVGIMYVGRIVEIAPADRLFEAPRHPYSCYLIDSIPDPHAFEHEPIPVSGETPSAISPPPGCAFHPRCPLAFDRCRREVPALTGVSPVTQSTEPRAKHSQPAPFRDEPDHLGRQSDSLRRPGSLSPGHVAGLELDREPLPAICGGNPALALWFDA